MRLRSLAIVALVFVVPATAWPQALTNLSSLRVGYNTRKNTVKPEGALKAQIDALDAQVAEAARLGKNGELRRLYAKGVLLLNGRPWTDEVEYAHSIVLRTDRVVVDSAKPYAVRLEQIFTPSINLERPLTAHVSLRKRPVPAAPNQQPTAPELVKDLGTFDGVARDLRESPFPFDLDLHDVADGGYVLVADVTDQSTSLGAAALPIALRKGLDDTITRLESEAKRAPDAVRAEILFPVDRVRNVNQGRLELRTFDPERDLASAEAVVASLETKKDPFAGRTGDFKRHYLLDAANEIIPYRM